ncbi:Mandelate racemase/muconate lactonizing protein [Desulfitobacterium hafniense DCB-2]|uniref:o-succinylbenzoate synthase n=1 Tax=Desulfitobacterium hafniense (strain DSM 10664 / DCB-2) TaxID=272564 RepID=B8FTZ2_DESHD|nr:o-succinylbenzoate synthase [Desulfitobacterium hafniense]ACL18541.1 Mandelate racemase/muconate lactonizing protein [Desulfitobacterium hafniense DCB-2]
MRIEKSEVFHLNMPMKFSFKSAQTILNQRETLVIKVTDELGHSGFGEAVAFKEPFYTGETLPRAKEVLLQHLLPRLLGREIPHPFAIHSWPDLGYPMAVAGVENALLDGFARRQQQPIMDAVFHEETQARIYGGMVLGDLEPATLLRQIEDYLQEGYVRFKIKIKPGDGFAKLQRVREKYPDLMLLADGNRSFQAEQLPELREMDQLGLLCLEEPLASGNLVSYQRLQEQMRTPLCLDESIQTKADLIQAAELRACQAVNLKVGRVGGLAYVKEMIEICRKRKIHYWIGSMMESGISKILHVHLASLKDNYIPGDLSSSRRYFARDVIRPEITVQRGLIQVPRGPGLGVEIDEEALKYYTVDQRALERGTGPGINGPS